jgi:two-component system, OmpR family, sensor histidine kinase KdpD
LPPITFRGGEDGSACTKNSERSSVAETIDTAVDLSGHDIRDRRRLRRKSVPAILADFAPRAFVLTESDRHGHLAGYAKSVLVVGLITSAGLLVNLRSAPTNVGMLYLAGVVFGALRWGFGPALLSAILSTFVFDYVFIRPYLSFAITDFWYLITLLAMMGVGILISVLASAAREQALTAKRRAADSAALYSLTQSLSAAREVDPVLRAAGGHIRTAFGRAVAILLPEEGGKLTVRYHSPDFELDDKTHGKGERIFQQALHDPTNRGCGVFLPLKCGERVLGVIALPPVKPAEDMSGASERILEGVAGQVALAIERAGLEEKARQAEVLGKAEELQRTLLHSVSHSLRTPLAAIVSALDPIADPDMVTNHAAIAELASIAQGEAHRLDRLVGNLLDLSRLEAGALKLRREPHDIQDIVGTALGEIEHPDRLIESIVHPGVPLVTVDFVLVVRVLVNLLENAMKYSPAVHSIRLEVRATGSQMELRVSDCGCGIPTAERQRIFQRFFRLQETASAPGLGLGLAVCKGFIEAHNGKIWVEDRPGGGSVFCFTIPLEAQ